LALEPENYLVGEEREAVWTEEDWDNLDEGEDEEFSIGNDFSLDYQQVCRLAILPNKADYFQLGTTFL